MGLALHSKTAYSTAGRIQACITVLRMKHGMQRVTRETG
jgi:hypothetical protein